MKMRYTIAAYGAAVLAAFALVAPSAASAAPSAAAAPPAIESCFVAASNSVIELRSCNWRVTVKRVAGCRTGHFHIWNRFNPGQNRNSPDQRWCPTTVGGYEWHAGEPWSNETCGTFWYFAGGRWWEDGSPICNHDA